MADGTLTSTNSAQISEAGQSLAEIARLVADKRFPPVERWNPPYCGAIDMRIRKDGSWWYLGTPIGRPAMVKLFSTVLRRDPDGQFYLVTPVEKLGITVEDAPFLAVEVVSEKQGRQRRLGFRLNTDDYVIAGPQNRVRVAIDPRTQEPRPYLHVRQGLEALINRSVFYELVDMALADAEDGILGLWSNDIFFPLSEDTV